MAIHTEETMLHTMPQAHDSTDPSAWQQVGLAPPSITESTFLPSGAQIMQPIEAGVVAEQQSRIVRMSEAAPIVGKVGVLGFLGRLLHGETGSRASLQNSGVEKTSENEKLTNFFNILDTTFRKENPENNSTEQSDYSARYTLERMLLEDDRLIQACTVAIQEGRVSDWDRLRLATIARSASRSVVVTTETDPFFDDTPSIDLDPAAIKAAEQKTAQLTGLAELSDPEGKNDNGPEIYDMIDFLCEYSGVAKEGVSVAEARAYERIKVPTLRYPKADKADITASEIKTITGLLESATPAVKAVLRHNSFDPLTVLGAKDIITDALKDVDVENSRELYEKAAEVASFLMCDQPESGVVQLVRSLMDKGASYQGLHTLFGFGANLALLKEQDVPAQTLDVITKLTTFPELIFSNGTNESNDRIVKRIIRETPNLGLFAEELTKRYPEVRTFGYDPSIISSRISYTLSPYAYNNMLGDGSEVPELFRQRLSSVFDAMDIAGKSGAQLDALFSEAGAPVGGMIESLSLTLLRGDRVDRKEFSEAVDTVATSLLSAKGLFPEHFNDIAAVVSTLEQPDKMAEFTAIATELAAYADFIESQSGTVSFLHVLRDMSRRYDYENKAYQPGLVEQVAMVKAVTDEIPALKQLSNLGQCLREMPDVEALTELLGVLRSDFVKEHLDDEVFRRSLDGAFWAIRAIHGKVNLERSWQLTIPIKKEAKREYFASLVNTERICQDMGVSDKLFFAVAEKALPKKDKDGNPYDFPTSLVEFFTAVGARPNMTEEQTRRLQETIDWYTASELPIAAATSVMKWRGEAKQDGVPDSPRAIYDWIYGDAEKVEELSHNALQQYVYRLLGTRGFDMEQLSADKIIDAARELAVSMQDDFRVFINVHPETLQIIEATDGRLLSTFDLQGQRQDYDSQSQYDLRYMGFRSGIEVALGIRSLDASDGHAIYGTAGYIGDGVPDGAIGYGNILITLNSHDSHRDEISFTPEDSFHGASRLTREDAQIVRIIKSGLGIGDLRTSDYVEAQIPFDVTLDAIDQVYVSSAQERDALPASLRNKAIVRLPANPTEPSYRATREKALMERMKNELNMARASVTAIDTAGVESGALTGAELLDAIPDSPTAPHRRRH